MNCFGYAESPCFPFARFHFSVSLGYKTTFPLILKSKPSLWIALATPNRLAFPLLDFIFQYLWDTKQHSFSIPPKSFSCELLSFFSIFGIQNNRKIFVNVFTGVVNCFGYAESPCFPFARFHFSVSLGYKTTRKIKRFERQSCELLSFFSIFGIQNNWARY